MGKEVVGQTWAYVAPFLPKLDVLDFSVDIWSDSVTVRLVTRNRLKLNTDIHFCTNAENDKHSYTHPVCPLVFETVNISRGARGGLKITFKSSRSTDWYSFRAKLSSFVGENVLLLGDSELAKKTLKDEMHNLHRRHYQHTNAKEVWDSYRHLDEETDAK